MMYRTRKVLSIAPPSTLGTAVARNAILLALPQLGACLFVFLITLDRQPLFGKLLGILFLLHLPALLFRRARTAQCSIDTKTMQVNWKSAKHVDQKLLTTSLGSLFFFALLGTAFFVIFR